jgi:alpha-glucosidase
VLIGEIYLPIHKLVTYYGENNSGAHLPFNFQLLTLPWNSREIATAVDTYEGALPVDSWPNWVLSNHDKPRVASRVGPSQARIAAMLLLTLRGTPTIYYGDEIGMTDVPIPVDEIVDPQGLNMPELNVSRDPSRTPMQWGPELHAGFSQHKPWLRLPYNAGRINVEKQKQDAYSMLSFYRKLIDHRKKSAALSVGSYSPVYSDAQLMSYLRQDHDETFLVILNLSHRPAYFRPQNASYKGVITLSTDEERTGMHVQDVISLAGDEGLLIRIDDE